MDNAQNARHRISFPATITATSRIQLLLGSPLRGGAMLRPAPFHYDRAGVELDYEVLDVSIDGRAMATMSEEALWRAARKSPALRDFLAEWDRRAAILWRSTYRPFDGPSISEYVAVPIGTTALQHARDLLANREVILGRLEDR